MTEPAITTSTVSGSTTANSSSTSATTIDPFRELCMSREAQAPSRGHLPLTVWLAAADTEAIAACAAGCCHPVSGPLARHLIATCARLGETVVHLGAGDHQLVSAALTAGCLPVAVFTDAARADVTWTRLARTHTAHDLEVTDLRITEHKDDEAPLTDLIRSAGLVVTEQICDQPGRRLGQASSHDEARPHGIAAAARLVKPDGHLAVVTGLHRQGDVADPMPKIITQARSVGLVYLQHIVALRHSARGECIEPDLLRSGLAALQDLPQCTGLPASARVHSDVLLFTRPRGLPEPHGRQAPPAGSAGSQAATGSIAQAGSER
ncbi:hypothetical protein [Nonomuraea sp. NPDC049607]|uniref:hypothetical protein n=1 Tax=Nonomuraea sp. NPDC049607 TaxID=3154732 RepID=UPI003412A34F